MYFVMAYDAGIGFDSAAMEQHGPFTLLDTKDYTEFYNLRYGAMSVSKPIGGQVVSFQKG